MARATDTHEILAARVVAVDERLAERLTREHFGVVGTAQRLASERDQNFHLAAADGAAYVLKITNPAEDRGVTAFQTGALQHIAQVDQELPVPKLAPTRDGRPEAVASFDDGQRILRLMSFLPGEPLYKVPASSAQRHNLGRTLARLGVALRGYFHPAAGHELLWDIKHGGRLYPLLAQIEDPRRRALAQHFLDGFEGHAAPLLPKLRAQVIHNDFQPWNVLVHAAHPERVTGVIDFGDMVHAPLIDDLAVACAYHLADAPQPLAPAAELVAAYHETCPLEPMEIDILFDLIATRLVMTVAITNWRAQLHPENRTYILRNAPRSWTGLERFVAIERRDAVTYLRHACGME